MKNTQLPKNISWITLDLNTTNISKLSNDSGINVFLMDPANSLLMFPITFQMKGIPIRVELKDKGYHRFQTRISQYRNVEENPQFNCKDYSLDNTYGECVRKELIGRYIGMFNCTPPWLQASKRCNKRLNLKEAETEKLNELLFFDRYKSEL